MHLDDAAGLTASADALGQLLGLTGRRVAQLEAENAVLKVERGKYDVAASVRMYAAYIKDAKRNGNAGGANYDDERARLTKIKADIAQLQLDALQGKSHDSESVAAVWGDMVSNVRKKLLSLGATFAPQMEGMEVVERKALLDEGVRAALNDLADYSPEAVTGKYIERHKEEIQEQTEE